MHVAFREPSRRSSTLVEKNGTAGNNHPRSFSPVCLGKMRAAVLLCAVAIAMEFTCGKAEEDWWEHMSLYQIYPRSFKDSDGDGTGDLKGIIEKLDHLVDVNVDAFWLSPICRSPMVDFGYDISDFKDIDPIFGTMDDLEELVRQAHERNLKVIMDFVPNHSSDQHEWFQKSLKSIDPYTDYYVWRPGKVLENGTVTVPNNWVSVFGGPAWTWREERQAYYLHQFAPEQPDLNFNNENVIHDIKDVLRFWADKGIDGFRMDAIPHLCEDPEFLDEPLSGHTDDPNNYGYTEKVYTKDQPRTYEMVRGWREVLDECAERDGYKRVMMIEAYANMSMTMKYYEYGAHFPFNFGLITEANKNSDAADIKRLIDNWMSNMPTGGTANWVAGNHDNSRLVTRFGKELAQVMTILVLLLPGVSVTYNGDEIGMEDTAISWEDTVDPQGCNAGPEHYAKASRDPERTPFQWDDTVAAGFSTNEHTWLPVNENYKTLNLAAQKQNKNSYFALYQAVSQLKRSVIVKDGNLVTELIGDNVLAFARRTEKHGSVFVLINFDHDEEKRVDLTTFENVPDELLLYYATNDASGEKGSVVTDITALRVPAQGAAIYIGTS